MRRKLGSSNGRGLFLSALRHANAFRAAEMPGGLQGLCNRASGALAPASVLRSTSAARAHREGKVSVAWQRINGRRARGSPQIVAMLWRGHVIPRIAGLARHSAAFSCSPMPFRLGSSPRPARVQARHKGRRLAGRISAGVAAYDLRIVEGVAGGFARSAHSR